MKKKITEKTGNPRMDEHDDVKSLHSSVTVVGDHIYFYGGIDERSAMELNRAMHAVSMKLAPTAFSSMQEVGQPAPLWLHINSMGGEVFSSFAIADTIERISIITPVITVVEGCAASGATIMSTAGTKRLMRKNAFMLIHELSDLNWGKYTELKDSMKSNDTIMKSIKEWYLERTKLPQDKIDEILSHDIWWNAKQCLKFGLVDQVI